MKRIAQSTARWIIFLGVTAWFGLSLCVLAGEDAPNASLSLLMFFAFKICALISLFYSGKAIAVCERKALFPPIVMAMIKLLEEEED